MFSGGDYEENARWLRNFLTAHAKRENPRIEVELDSEGERDGKSYGVRLVFEGRSTPVIEFDFREVAEHRGSLAWCAAVAQRIRVEARALIKARGARARGTS